MGAHHMTFEEKLVALRKEKGLSQLQLAEQLNVSRQAVSRWESGFAFGCDDRGIDVDTFDHTQRAAKSRWHSDGSD